MSDDLARAARAYHDRGWCLVPMRMTTKRPACRWKRFQSRRPDGRQVRKWFANGDRGLGVLFGDISGGLASRDFDAMPEYEKWAAEYPDLSGRLPTVETRRGRHVYFQVDPAKLAYLRRQIGKPDGTGAIKARDGELRAGVGCYSVLPPSKHPSGHVYRWKTPLPDCPLPKIDVIEAGLFTVGSSAGEPGGAGPSPTGLGPVGPIEPDCDDQTQKHPLCPQDTLCSLVSLPSLLHESVERAIHRTLPTKPRQRHENVFRFARELKAIPELADVPARALKPIVVRWHDLAKQFYRTPWEEHWFDFAEAWGKIRYPAGQGAVDMAFARALEAELPQAVREYEQPKLQLFVSLCRELQRSAGDGPFFLDCRTAGRLLDVDHSTASRWLRGLRSDGILQCVRRGSLEDGRASRYRYLADL